ncbi:U1 snRNP protein, partial [Teratosphaeriaceae sp. CCFEE 6253]
MLATHEDITHFTRWKTAKPLIEREAVFKQAGTEDERRQMFDEYVGELKRKHAELDLENRRTAMQELDSILKVL